MTGHMRGDARKRRSPETDTPVVAVAHNGQLSDTEHPSLAKYRRRHEEARQEVADLWAENQRLREELSENREWVGHLAAERDRLAGIVERVKALADEWEVESERLAGRGFHDDGRMLGESVDDLRAAIESDGGERS